MSNEIEFYKNKLKNNIRKLIENNRLEEANELLTQYEATVHIDIDVYSMRAIILMVKGNFIEAEEILKEGLALESNNFNLLYNISYLYQASNRNSLAIKYYKKALDNASNDEDIELINTTLLELGYKDEGQANLLEKGTSSVDKIIQFNNTLRMKYSL